MATEISRAPLVGVVMGSKSDWETMRHASEVLTELGIPHESKVVSAHRTPERLFRYGREAEGRGPGGVDRRRRRGGALAGDAGGDHDPAGAGRAGREQGAARGRLAAVDRADAARRAGRHAGHRRLGRGQRGDPGRGDPGAEVSRRSARPWPASARLRPTPWESRRHDDVASPIARDAVPRAAALFPPASLGVIGSGQLGRMFIQAAQRMGYRAGVLSATEDTPAAQVAHWTVIGPADHLPALRAFAERAEAVTVEFENVSAPALRWLARRRPVRPGWRTVWVCQNRLREKRFLARHSIPHAPWRPVRTAAELDAGRPRPRAAADPQDGRLGLRRQGAGPGRPRRPRRPAPGPAWAGRPASPRPGSISPPRSRSSWPAARDGRAVCYPVALNRHERHILDATLMPAPVGPIVAQEARDLALAVAQALGTVGVLTVEFFLTADGRLLVNEIAPRPHNSGHLTIEAAVDQPVRAAGAGPLRVAAGPGRPGHAGGDGQLAGRLVGQAGGEPRWEAALRARSGRLAPPLRQADAGPGPQDGPPDRPRPRSRDRALTRALAARQRPGRRPVAAMLIDRLDAYYSNRDSDGALHAFCSARLALAVGLGAAPLAARTRPAAGSPGRASSGFPPPASHRLVLAAVPCRPSCAGWRSAAWRWRWRGRRPSAA